MTLLFFHSGAIYHVHRKHGALTRNLSTNTATADNLKHTSDPKTLSFTRNDPLRTSVPSRGWGKDCLRFVFALCDPELLHQVAKDLGLDLAAQTPPVALSTLPLARVLDALIAASVPDPGVESQVVSTELAQC